MAAGSQKKLWRRLSGKLGAELALLSFIVTGIGIPLPAANLKDHSIPFPCQGHACGCPSAEQCWRHCCCFSAAERWAWAREHHVEPPAYAERATGDDDKDHATSVCCHDHQTSEPKDSQNNSQPSVRWVLSFSALHCGGPATSWLGSGALAPPPPVTCWSPMALPVGWLSLRDFSPSFLAIAPLDPPPRSSFS